MAILGFITIIKTVLKETVRWIHSLKVLQLYFALWKSGLHYKCTK